MDTLVNELKNIIPDIKFQKSKTFCWSPATQTIGYPAHNADDTLAKWSLLHESGHALLRHNNYTTDIELLLMEVAAWNKAKELAKKINIKIDEDHIQDCLDTYRDWLHQRSTCPICSVVCLQVNARQYQCHNCGASWTVSASRFCRPYRLVNRVIKKSPLEKTPSATFL